MTLYRLLVGIFALWILAGLALRRDGAAIRARLGGGGAPEAGGAPHVWLHAASNGELASAAPLLERWHDLRPDLRFVVTCNSDSGVALARRMGHAATLAPLDLRRAVGRFCARWNVEGHIALESEIWPHRFLLVDGPVVMLGARLSEGSARMWQRVPRLAARVLGRVRFASAQDEASRGRLRALGLPAAAEGPVADLKAFYTPPEGPPPDAALAACFDRGRTWLAASTHPGEEEIVLDAHAAARAEVPDLALILAPRHPRRGSDVAALARARGFDVARRSAGEAPRPGAVYLADTLGEMPLWYRLAGTVFVAGTLSDRGGHTPYEPAAFGAALIHGPDTRNFRAPFAALAASGGALAVGDAAGLAAAVIACADPERRAALAAAAHRALAPGAGPDALAARVAAIVAPSP